MLRTFDRVVSAAAAALSAFLTGALGAEPAPRADSLQADLDLQDQVVTATRNPRPAATTPRAVNLVDLQALGERMPRNSAEALREEAGIQVQKTEHGGGNAIIRGMGSSQVLLLVDGMRLNNGTYRFGNHPYLTTVDFNLLERVEVMRGPGSTLYGSDAMGGTVNLITRSPAFAESGLQAGGRAFARYGSADEEKIGRVEARVSGPRFGVLAGAGIQDAGDLRRGTTSFPWGQGPARTDGPLQPHSGYSGRDHDAKAAFALTPSQRLTAGWQSTARPLIPRYDRYEDPGFYRWNYTDQNRDLAYLRYDLAGRESFLPAHAFLSFHRQEEGRDFQRAPTANTTREWGETRSLGSGVQAGYKVSNHALTAGGEGYFDRVASDRFIVNASTGAATRSLLGLYPDGSTYASYGLFAQDEMRFGPLYVVAGARFNFVRMEYKIPVDTSLRLDFGEFRNDFPSLTGSLGLSYNLAAGVFLVGNVSQGYRAPNLSDVARNGETRNLGGGVIGYEIPNPGLEPEKVTATEGGIRLQFPRVKGQATWFFSDIRDALDTRTATLRGDSNYASNGTAYKLQSKQNVGEAWIQGVETDAAALLYARLWLHGNFTYTYGKNTTLDEPYSGIPPAFGLAGLKWKEESYLVDLYARFAGDQRRLSAADHADARVPQNGTRADGTAIRRSLGWYTVNLRGEYRLNRAALRGGVENVFDFNYREHGSGINAPGRNFILAVEYRQ